MLQYLASSTGPIIAQTRESAPRTSRRLLNGSLRISFMTVEFLKTIFDWIAVILLFLTFAAGVGVLVTGNIINKRQGVQLRQFDKNLTEAKTELGKQQERAAIADAKVAGLQQSEADAKAEMAKQQTRAAKAERSLLELQERVKIRHLTTEQRKQLIKFLESAAVASAPKGPIRVQRLIFDETAQPFAEEIKEAFGAAGWSSDEVGRDMIDPGGRIPIGVVLIFHSSKNMPAHTGVVQHALMAAGIEPTLGENPNIPERMVEIMIGVKP